MYRLNNAFECDKIPFQQCDISTCFNFNYSTCGGNGCVISSHVMCSSYCDNQRYCHTKPAFQCSDNTHIFLDHFCDGVVDCADGSDEIRNKPGFKCNQCVLPQSNLYDDLAHCNDDSDLCLFGNSASCFQCLDMRLLISAKQVCDGVSDCYDLSDECLCDNHIDACIKLFESKKNLNKVFTNPLGFYKMYIHSIQFDKKSITCSSKFGSVQAQLCDGRPECSNYGDECQQQCTVLPPFCNDSCHSFFSMGDRYCNGVEDSSWIYINDTACPQGFDELECPKRFKCNASGNVSIDVLLVCDGKPDCDDRSDENNCPAEKNEAIFSSDTEMIANPALRAVFWIIGSVVLIGNAFVIINLAVYLKKQKVSNFLAFQHVIILNISIADFIMGLYLITIAAYSAKFSGIYGLLDREWRSSLNCFIVGSLSVISSESSCFLMVILSAFRLITIYDPINSLTLSLRPWKICVGATWLLSICLSVIPMLGVTSSYFVHSISFSSRFHRSGWIEGAQLKQFMSRYAFLSNKTVKDYGSELESIEMFLKNNLPESLPMRMFGYYGATSVCMPRFYVGSGEPTWEYTIALITVNFLCFVFVAASYVLIFLRSAKSSASVRSKQSTKSDSKSSRIQGRIARIIATDFCCWIPICVMAYVRLGIDFSNIVYQISAVILLPINSALNPFLFSSLPDKLISFCKFKTSKFC